MIWKFEISTYIYITKQPPIMNLMPLFPSHLLVQQLRKANQIGWIDAAESFSTAEDKAGFDAIGSI